MRCTCHFVSDNLVTLAPGSAVAFPLTSFHTALIPSLSAQSREIPSRDRWRLQPASRFAAC